MTTNTDDKRISNTYRELADERVPAALDEKILVMAKEEARARRGLAPAWFRPVAWAATIGLTFAFLLEMSQLDEAPVPPASPAPVLAPAAEAEAPRRDVPQVDEEAGDAFVAEDVPLLRDAAERARAGEGDVRRMKTLTVQPVAAAVSMEKKEQAGPWCDDAARGSAESWYDCILELHEQGLAWEAATEFEALLEAFPDFREPAPE